MRKIHARPARRPLEKKCDEVKISRDTTPGICDAVPDMQNKNRLTENQLGLLEGNLATIMRIEQAARASDASECRHWSKLLELETEIFLLKCGLEIETTIKKGVPMLGQWPYAPEQAQVMMSKAENQKLASFVAYCLFCGDAAAIAHFEALQDQVDGCRVWCNHWLQAMGYELRKTEQYDRWIIRDTEG